MQVPELQAWVLVLVFTRLILLHFISDQGCTMHMQSDHGCLECTCICSVLSNNEKKTQTNHMEKHHTSGASLDGIGTHYFGIIH